MSKVQCNSCGGTFYDIQPDGSRYFHECPAGTPNPVDEDISPASAPGTDQPINTGGGVTILQKIASFLGLGG